MFKFIVFAFVFLGLVYYIDIVVRIIQDEKAGKIRYKGLKLIIPFAYWLFPHRDKKRKVKPKKSKQNEAK
jgi:hypothetical protein